MSLAYEPYSRVNAPSPELRRPPFNRFSPRLAKLRRLILDAWPGTAGGSGYVIRRVRGGSPWSAHAYGGAWDCYLPPVAQPIRDSITSWLIEHADVIGLQMVNDYHARRRWTVGRGWQAVARKPDDKVTGWGWKGHLHIEIHPDRWADTTALPPLDAVSAWRPGMGTTLDPTGNAFHTYSVQQRLNGLGYGLTVDGIYGPRTRAAVRDFQATHGLKVDGIVGPLTLAALVEQGRG